jgi:hypothetical protein
MIPSPLTVCIYPQRTKDGEYKLVESVFFGDVVPMRGTPHKVLRRRTRLWKPAKLPNGRGQLFESRESAIEFYLWSTT